MTLFKPTLLVNRMVIERNGIAVYDEQFHVGINIIRGENSSGKSTVLNFLFYGLGGDLTDWSETAQLCTRVVVEVRLNGAIATLSREVSSKRGRGMEIFGGSYVDSKSAPIGNWHRFPYARTKELESFSQSIFRLLDMPDVANEQSGNLTMHQVLRLLYADQLSPVEQLFKFERFDSPDIRDAVGRLLCGTYESEIYENELALRRLQKQYDFAASELHSMLAIVGGNEHALTLESLYEQEKELEEKRTRLQGEIEKAERQVSEKQGADAFTLQMQQEKYETVRQLQAQIVRAKEELDAVHITLVDSAAFIESLEAKLISLKDTALVADFASDVKFGTCPACYAALNVQSASDASACYLCGTPYGSSSVRERIAAIVNETALQLSQSRRLQDEREVSAKKLAEDLKSLESRWQIHSRELSDLTNLPSTKDQFVLRDLQRKLGYLDREIEGFAEKRRLIIKINEKRDAKSELQSEIEKRNTQNTILKATQKNRLEQAYDLIAAEIRGLLERDLRRQDSFESPQDIQFSFRDNSITVDGHSYFSASSRVILKSSFFLGFLSAAAKNSLFRHPRFCILDTIEDKGMEVARSHNFQNQIARVSAGASAEHQIIFATAMIAPDLDKPEFTVGAFSTRDRPTLKIGSLGTAGALPIG